MTSTSEKGRKDLGQCFVFYFVFHSIDFILTNAHKIWTKKRKSDILDYVVSKIERKREQHKFLSRLMLSREKSGSNFQDIFFFSKAIFRQQKKTKSRCRKDAERGFSSSDGFAFLDTTVHQCHEKLLEKKEIVWKNRAFPFPYLFPVGKKG